MQDSLTCCPECNAPVMKIVSLCNGFSRKQANQYPEVLHAKYWRDQNGVRHKVTSADGHAKSATVSRLKKVSPEVVEARRKRDMRKTKP